MQPESYRLRCSNPDSESCSEQKDHRDYFYNNLGANFQEIVDNPYFRDVNEVNSGGSVPVMLFENSSSCCN